MESPCSSIISAEEYEEGLHSPLTGIWPRTTARHIYEPLHSPLSPLESKRSQQEEEKQEQEQQPKQNHYDCYGDYEESLENTPFWSHRNSSPTLSMCKTEKHSLLPTFYRGNVHDAAGVSVRLETEFMGATREPESSMNIHNTLYTTPDAPLHLSPLKSRQLQTSNSRNEIYGIDVVESTRVFVDPMPLPSSPHTPPDNIFPCSATQTPHNTHVPLTPQKSARRPSTRMLTPSVHRRHASSVSLAGASPGPACGILRSGSHVDLLAPNRNPCSPYRDFAATWGLTPVIKGVDTTGMNTASAFLGDGGGGNNSNSSSNNSSNTGLQCPGIPSVMTSEGIEYCTPQRAEACIVMFSQTVPTSNITSPRVFASNYSHSKKKGQGTMSCSLNDISRDTENLSPIIREIETSGQTVNTDADDEEENEEEEKGVERSLNYKNTSHVARNLNGEYPSHYVSDPKKETIENHDVLFQMEVLECDAPLRNSTGDGSFSDVSPHYIRSTCSFSGFEISRRLGYESPKAGTGILNSVPRWSSNSGLHDTRNIMHGNSNPERTPVFFTNVIHGDSQREQNENFLNLITDEQQQQQEEEQEQEEQEEPFCRISSTRYTGNNDAYMATHTEHENEDEEHEYHSIMSDMENEEFEPGDRFRHHHRYQFLHWIPWRKMYNFVPIHLDRNGVVWLATHRIDGLPYAVKEIPFSDKDSFKTELECLTLGNAPVSPLQQQAADHIVRYYTVSPYSIVSGESNDHVALLLQIEYFPMGNVMEWALDPNEILRGAPYSVPTESFWSCVLQHGLLALEALHAARIIHGNPLPFNLFIHSQRHFKLGNFGSSVKLPNEYPLGTPDIFLPSITEKKEKEMKKKFTPYDVDIFVFAKGILHLVTQCILKRKEYIKRADTNVKDKLNSEYNCFTSLTETLTDISFQEYRTSGFHDLSDNIWYVLQAALHGTSIQDLLKMLNTPSRLLWGVISLFETEELYLQQKRHKLLKELQKRKEKKEHDKNPSTSPKSGFVDNHQDYDPISLSSLRPQRHSLHCTGEKHINPSRLQEQHNVFPLPFVKPLPLLGPSLASRHKLTDSSLNSNSGSFPWTTIVVPDSPFHSKKERNLPFSTRTQFNNRKSEPNASPLSLAPDFSYQSHMHSPFSFPRHSSGVKRSKRSVRCLFDGDGDAASIPGSTGIGSVSHMRIRDETFASCSNNNNNHHHHHHHNHNHNSNNNKVLDESLEWTFRQVMTVMHWRSTVNVDISREKGMTSSSISSSSASLLPIRPLTSWE